MNQHSALPPVLIPFRHRLAYRQVRTAVLLGLFIGMLLGVIQVTLDLEKERQRIRTTIAQVVAIIQDSASLATFQNDTVQAEKVLTSLLKCQSIYQASLKTATNTTLMVKKSHPIKQESFAYWLNTLLVTEQNTFTTPLQYQGQPSGQLSISIDPHITTHDFLMRASFTLLSNLLAAILLATILSITFHNLLTRPLQRLGRQLAQINPNEPSRQSISVPDNHENDELGLVTRHIHFALDSFATALRTQKEMEKLLKRTQFSMDHAADMICWTNSAGEFIYTNHAMSQITEYAPDELISMRVTEINPEITSAFWNNHWSELKTAKTGRMESSIKTKSGETIPIEIHITLLEIDGQEIHCNFAREISSRKATEKTIKRANDILRTLSLGNEAMIKATSEQELLNRICQLIVTEGGYRMVWVGFATFDEQKRILPAAQYGFDDGYLNQLEITWADTEKGRGPTGTAFRTQKPALSRQIQTDPNFTPWRQEATQRGFASSLSLPLPNKNEHPLGTINIYSGSPDAFDKEEIQLLENLANNLAFGILKFREAEKRLRAEAARQHSEEKLSTLFHHSPDCLMTLDQNGTVHFSNRKEANHQQPLLSKALMPHLQERLAIVFQTGQAIEYPFTDGESTWWEARLAPIFHNGKVSEVLAVCQDITEKRTLQAQNLRNARLASLGVLSASIAHEINNPNNAIQFNVPILATIWEDACPILQTAHDGQGAFYLGDMPLTEAMEVVPQLLDGIHQSSHRIKTIIGGLKHMARQDQEVMTQHINIHDPIQSAMMILQSQIRQTTDHCTLIPSNIPLIVKGNAQQLEQAFINIIQNALQSLSNRKQKITISTALDPSYTHILILLRDQGCGIDPEQLAKLTDPFFTTRRAAGGIGLGLSITKTIIENHAGELLFASQLNQGTLVTVRLPIDTAQPRGVSA